MDAPRPPDTLQAAPFAPLVAEQTEQELAACADARIGASDAAAVDAPSRSPTASVDDQPEAAAAEVDSSDDDADGGDAPPQKRRRRAEHACDICGKTYPKPWRLAEHILTHTGDRHLRSHVGDKPLACPHEGCTLRFTTATHLKRHQLVHERPKPYQCPVPGCGASFAKHLQLRKHDFIHTGVRAYPCTHPGCPDSFDSVSKLQRHQVIHSSVPRYECAMPECGAGFSRWKDLSHHTRAEHRKNGYACEHCPSVFADRKHWRAHLATHDPARERFPCPYDGCGKAFTTRRNLRNHVASFHQSERALLRQLRQQVQQEASCAGAAAPTLVDALVPAPPVRTTS